MICPALQDFLSEDIQLDYCTFESTHHPVPFSLNYASGYSMTAETTLDLRYSLKSSNTYIYFKIQCDSYYMEFKSKEFSVYYPLIQEIRAENNEFILPIFDNELMDRMNKLIKREEKVSNIERIINLYLETYIGANSNHLSKDQIEKYFNTQRELFEKEDKVITELERIKGDFR